MAERSFRPPQQRRSAATLDRIVRAAEELLAERSFEEATVDDIVARAGSSKGSFYSRFADKEALLAYLGGECTAQAKASWGEQLDPDATEGMPVEEVVDAFVGRLLEEYERSGPVLRALVLEARLRPGTEFERLTDELDGHIRDGLQRFLEARRAELPGVDPARAATVGMLMLDATTREAAFFTNPRGGPLAVDRTTLRRELVRAYVAYLRAG
jgi:AcrR family transcriptional regulator